MQEYNESNGVMKMLLLDLKIFSYSLPVSKINSEYTETTNFHMEFTQKGPDFVSFLSFSLRDQY